jgi:hypothetical protein
VTLRGNVGVFRFISITLLQTNLSTAWIFNLNDSIQIRGGVTGPRTQVVWSPNSSMLHCPNKCMTKGLKDLALKSHNFFLTSPGSHGMLDSHATSSLDTQLPLALTPNYIGDVASPAQSGPLVVAKLSYIIISLSHSLL